MNEDNRLIKDFQYWSVIIAKNQILPGKCIIWCKREDALDPADATYEEWQEVLMIIKTLKQTVKELYDADWFNYTFLGNSTHHLHMHFVPRYETERTVHGIKFVDTDWGLEYKPRPDFRLPSDVLQSIKNDITTKLKELLSNECSSSLK